MKTIALKKSRFSQSTMVVQPVAPICPFSRFPSPRKKPLPPCHTTNLCLQVRWFRGPNLQNPCCWNFQDMLCPCGPAATKLSRRACRKFSAIPLEANDFFNCFNYSPVRRPEHGIFLRSTVQILDIMGHGKFQSSISIVYTYNDCWCC